MTNKKTIAGLMVTAFLAIFAMAASAASLADLQTRELLREGSAAYNDYNDGRLMEIGYVGSSTQAAINISSYAITSQTPLGTSDTTLSFDFRSDSNYDTLGELCDKINSLAYYTCKLLDGKRDDSSILMSPVDASSSTDAKAAGGYKIAISTGGVGATDPYISRLGIIPNSGKRVILKKCIVQNDGTGTLLVHGKLKKYANTSDGVTRNDSTVVWNQATANDTALTQTWQDNVGGGLEFAPDAHVVISAGNGTTTQTSTSYVSCFWDEK